MKSSLLFILTLFLTLSVSQNAFAYIGPGAGLSMLGAFWGLVIAVLAALSFLLLWPIRRMFRKSNAGAASTDVESQDKPAN